MENAVLGSASLKPRAKVVLPAPDGAEIMNRFPWFTTAAHLPGAAPYVLFSARHRFDCSEKTWRSHPISLDILDLLAHLFDEDLQVHGRLGHVDIDCLGAERIGLSVEFLHQEIQAAADSTAAS